ncbi:ThiF family adenylyltransferase [Cellulomonas phragmiteti]|uniref:Cyclodehydratase n=1 Tax=Cellulomonas phragmiteti TaxID=478780 RepID=A0ABQ4DQQ0_9CELL|nr:ThiF family adenylyltransferase [Cellulomonas phragmiteti]GIG41686.1 cyclodehydratase [Cellulomonas phragmiteti]
MTRATRAPVLLRPGLRVLPRADDEVQVGTDPRWAVRLVDLRPAEVRLWTSVDDATDLARLPARARAAGLDPDAVAATVGELQRAGLTRARPEPSAAVRGPAAADATAWSLLQPDATGDAVVAARADAVVGLVGLGPTGLGIARQLAVAGVGTLLLDDDAPVRSPDVAGGTHRWADVGTARSVAARRVLRDAAPGVRCDGDAVPDVVVVVEHDAADPVRAARLVAEDVVHLSVVLRAADAVVGPLVRPGTDPCLRCLDLHRADADPGWPTVLGALTGPTASGSPATGEVGVLAGSCAAIAAAQVLVLLAGGVPALCGATTEITLPGLVAVQRRWATHPACGCRVPPRTTDAGPREA